MTQYTAKDIEEARKVAQWTNRSVEEILRGWDEQAEYEAACQDCLDNMFPLDD